MHYPANFITSSEGGFVVTFKDIPEAITQAESIDEAMEMAQSALVTAMEFYFEDRRLIPSPSTAEEGDCLVRLPASVQAKVLLLNTFLASNITQVELAKLLGSRPQQVTRLIDLKHSTKIDEIERALNVLGKSLSIRAVNQA